MRYVDSNTLSYQLFEFINSGLHNSIQANEPMITDLKTFSTICENPDPALISAIKHLINSFLGSIYPYDSTINKIDIPVSVISMVFAIYNCLAIKDLQKEDEPDHVFEFTQSLIKSIPYSNDLIDALCFHSIVQLASKKNNLLSLKQKQLFSQCINSNSVSKLVLINYLLPVDLCHIAKELIPEWKESEINSNLPQKNDWINDVEKLLDDKHLNRWLIHEWLKLPLCLESCRNTGLVLEALRQKGNHKSFILDFYESCVYYHKNSQTVFDIYGALNTTEKLLSAPGTNKLSRKLNIKGQEYYIQFEPLMKLLNENQNVPNRCQHVHKDIISLILRLQTLDKYIPRKGKNKIVFGPM